MQSHRESESGPVTAYKLQISPGRHSARLHSWELPDVVGGFPGSVPPIGGHHHRLTAAEGDRQGQRRSTAAFADHDYFARPAADRDHSKKTSMSIGLGIPHHDHSRKQSVDFANPDQFKKTSVGLDIGHIDHFKKASVGLDIPHHDHSRKQSVDFARHEDLHLHPAVSHDPVVRRSKALDTMTTSAEDLGYIMSVPMTTTTIYVPESNELPDWYVQLNTTQMVTFHKVLRLLDSRELSLLDRSELFDLLKEVVCDVTASQVNEAIDDLQDQSVKGQLDFDEFLYTLAEINKTDAGEKEEQEEGEEEEKEGEKKKKKEKYSLAQKLYFSAIASFSVLGAIQSPLELQRKHKVREDQGPHLLGHFLQSQTRSWGKSKKLLETMMATMLRNARGQFSPYIHPLPFVRIGKRRRDPPHTCPRKNYVYPEGDGGEGSGGEHLPRPSVVASRKIQQMSPVAMAAYHKMAMAAENEQELDALMAEQEEIYLDEDDINYVLKVYAEHGSVVAQLPDIQLVPGIRQTLARISIYEPLCSSDRKRRQTMKQLRKQLKNLDSEDPRVRMLRQRRDRIKFFMPHVRRFRIPIPQFRPTRCERLNVTPVNIANMQKRINRKLEEYRFELKMSHVKHAWSLLERLPIADLPLGNRERFLQVFRAYQPLRLRDIYVINPYVPHISYLD